MFLKNRHRIWGVLVSTLVSTCIRIIANITFRTHTWMSCTTRVSHVLHVYVTTVVLCPTCTCMFVVCTRYTCTTYYNSSASFGHMVGLAQYQPIGSRECISSKMVIPNAGASVFKRWYESVKKILFLCLWKYTMHCSFKANISLDVAMFKMSHTLLTSNASAMVGLNMLTRSVNW